MKIVINRCYGGFGLSQKAITRLAELGYQPAVDGKYLGNATPRDHPLIVQVVEELGKNASNVYSELKIVEIPDGTNWEIQEYDGMEWIAESHRTWR